METSECAEQQQIAHSPISHKQTISDYQPSPTSEQQQIPHEESISGNSPTAAEVSAPDSTFLSVPNSSFATCKDGFESFHSCISDSSDVSCDQIDLERTVVASTPNKTRPNSSHAHELIESLESLQGIKPTDSSVDMIKSNSEISEPSQSSFGPTPEVLKTENSVDVLEDSGEENLPYESKSSICHREDSSIDILPSSSSINVIGSSENLPDHHIKIRNSLSNDTTVSIRSSVSSIAVLGTSSQSQDFTLPYSLQEGPDSAEDEAFDEVPESSTMADEEERMDPGVLDVCQEIMTTSLETVGTEVSQEARSLETIVSPSVPYGIPNQVQCISPVEVVVGSEKDCNPELENLEVNLEKSLSQGTDSNSDNSQESQFMKDRSPSAHETKESVDPLLTETEQTAAPAAEETEQTAAPATEETEQTAAPATEATEETATPVTEETEETVAPATEETEETEAPASEETKETAAPATEETDETAAPVTEETEETAVPATEETEETSASATEETKETSASASEETNETVALVTEETKETVALVTEETEQTAAPATQETKETAGPVIEETEETAVPATEETEETATPATEETEQTVALVTEESNETAAPALEQIEQTLAPPPEQIEQKLAPPPPEESKQATDLNQGDIKNVDNFSPESSREPEIVRNMYPQVVIKPSLQIAEGDIEVLKIMEPVEYSSSVESTPSSDLPPSITSREHKTSETYGDLSFESELTTRTEDTIIPSHPGRSASLISGFSVPDTINISEDHPASDLLVSRLAGVLPKDDVVYITTKQKYMLNKLECTNEKLRSCNQLSATQYEKAAQNFKYYTRLLVEMRRDVDVAFKRIHSIKGKLAATYPAIYDRINREVHTGYTHPDEDDLAEETVKYVDSSNSQAPKESDTKTYLIEDDEITEVK